MKVNGHKLPDELYTLIKDKDQKELPFISMESLNNILPDGVVVQGGFYGGLRLFSVEGIKSDSEFDHLLEYDYLAEIYAVASSKRNGKSITDLHILDVDNALNIAGNFDEETIALDYRLDPLKPTVVGSFATQSWILLANSFSEFAEKIGL